MRVTNLLTTVAALGAAALMSVAPASSAGSEVLYIPDDIAGGDTRSGGHYDVQEDGGLHIWTDSNTSDDKVALYFDGTDRPLGEVGEPSLELTHIDGTIPPGFQLSVDFDGTGGSDGILVGEPTAYGDNWWLSNDAAPFVKAGAPNTGGGYGSPWYGTLEEWAVAFPDATVDTFGFSLGSGVEGDYVIDSMSYDGTTYTFGEHTSLASKDDCKNGGWATSTDPVFTNQGQCVSHFTSKRG